MLLRTLRKEETELLKDFLYEAIFIPEGVEPPDRSIIEQPELSIYYDDFGSGMSSLSTLETFEFNVVKLDIGFISKIGKNQKSEAIIRDNKKGVWKSG